MGSMRSPSPLLLCFLVVSLCIQNPTNTWRTCAFGQGSLLEKVDVKSAYRNVPVRPDDRWLMGMLWDGALFIDATLPFGLWSAPKIFTAIADAVEWIAREQGVRFAIHYLDDFLVLGPPESQECAKALSTLLEVFHRLGLPVATNKLARAPPHGLNSWASK